MSHITNIYIQPGWMWKVSAQPCSGHGRGELQDVSVTTFFFPVVAKLKDEIMLHLMACESFGWF